MRRNVLRKLCTSILSERLKMNLHIFDEISFIRNINGTHLYFLWTVIVYEKIYLPEKKNASLYIFIGFYIAIKWYLYGIGGKIFITYYQIDVYIVVKYALDHGRFSSEQKWFIVRIEKKMIMFSWYINIKYQLLCNCAQFLSCFSSGTLATGKKKREPMFGGMCVLLVKSFSQLAHFKSTQRRKYASFF